MECTIHIISVVTPPPQVVTPLPQIVTPLPQTCTCVPINTCYQNLQSDGSGQIDIRIVNNVS